MSYSEYEKIFVEKITTNFDTANLHDYFRRRTYSYRELDEPFFLDLCNDQLFSNANKVGEFKTEDGHLFVVSSFKTEKELTERSGKRRQFELAKKVLKNEYRYKGGFFIFYDDQSNVRFSFVFNHINEERKRREYSNYKRYTYYLSQSETNKTFIQRMTLIDFKTLENIKDAFSVEKVTKEFYKELADWYFWALKKVKFPKDAEEEPNGRNIAMIRFITRFIFVWFMKQKGLVKDELFDKQALSQILKELSNEKTTYYTAILQNLFFATLNTPVDERKFRKSKREFGINNYMQHNYYRYEELFQNKEDMQYVFKGIPFLNGGLFECLDMPHNHPNNDTGHEIRIDGFSDVESKQPFFPNELFFIEKVEVDLNEEYNTNGKMYLVKGLINILKSYNFTIDENTPNDEEIALDPELLGRVFENLLASYNPETMETARKHTGSYYTPREIVNFMTEQTLKQYLLNRFPTIIDLKEKLDFLFSHDTEENPFSEIVSDQIINSIDELKILDPAVGSGAFLIDMLHKLVFILSKLDPNNKKWKKRQIEAIHEKNLDPELKRLFLMKIEESFCHNRLDFGRKLYLIQNCLFGVDIQPIAIQLSKLRFFLSLLVEETIDTNQENYGIQTLPNLETKLVAANTLVDLFKQENLNIQDARNKEYELLKLRDRHFLPSTYTEKKLLEIEDRKKRNELSEILEKYNLNSEASRKIVEWDPYNTMKASKWFSPEIMFGVNEGFDIIIGNPPYIPLSNSYIDEVLNNYYHYDTKKNSASFFIEFANRIVKEAGIVSFIIPKSFSYVKGWERPRKFILKSNILNCIVDVSKAFEEVLLEQVILIFTRIISDTDYNFFTGEGWGTNIKIFGLSSRRLAESLEIIPIYINNKKQNILNKLKRNSITLATISQTMRGLGWQKYVSETGKTKIIRGRNIEKYKIYGELVTVDLKSITKVSKKAQILKSQKIISQNIVAHVKKPKEKIIIMACYDEEKHLTMDTVMNTFIYDKNYSPYYITAIMNSNLAEWYYYWFVYNRAIRTMHFDSYYLEKLPIKKITNNNQIVISSLSKLLHIISAIENEEFSIKELLVKAEFSKLSKFFSEELIDPDKVTRTFLENKINELVYELYELSEDDVKLIEDNKYS